MCFYPLQITGNVKIWWRLDDHSLAVDLNAPGAFEKKDMGMTAGEFRAQSPEIFLDIYEMFHRADFVAGFAGGSVARLEIGDIIEAGLLPGDIPHLGMLLDWPNFERWAEIRNTKYIAVNDKLVIVELGATTTLPTIF